MNLLTNKFNVIFNFVPPRKQKNFDKRLQNMMLEDGPKTIVEFHDTKYNVPTKGLIKESNKITIEDDNRDTVLKFVKRSNKVSKLKQLAVSLTQPDLIVDLDELLQITTTVLQLKTIYPTLPDFKISKSDIKDELKQYVDKETLDSSIEKLNNSKETIHNRLLYLLGHIIPDIKFKQQFNGRTLYDKLYNYKPSDTYINNKNKLSAEAIQKEIENYQSIVNEIAQELRTSLPNDIQVSTPLNMFITYNEKDNPAINGILLIVSTIIDAFSNPNDTKDIVLASLIDSNVELKYFTTNKDKAKLTIGQLLKESIPLSLLTDQTISSLYREIDKQTLDNIYYLSLISNLSKDIYNNYFKQEKPKHTSSENTPETEVSTNGTTNT